MPNEFKPQFILDEQMLLSDAKITLAYQIREEVKETNRLLRKLVEQKEAPKLIEQKEAGPQTAADPEVPKVKIEKKSKKTE